MPIKISVTNDNLQITKLPVEKVGATSDVADKVLPWISGDKIDFGPTTKVAPVESAKVIMDIKHSATDFIHQKMTDQYDDNVPLVPDHFAFVDGHHVGMHG